MPSAECVVKHKINSEGIYIRVTCTKDETSETILLNLFIPFSCIYGFLVGKNGFISVLN